MRVRELYADARTAETMQEASALAEALGVWYPSLNMGSQLTRWQRLWGWVRALPTKIPLLGPQFRDHPSVFKRMCCLEEPVAIFGSWREIGVTVGLAVVLLDLATRGILTASYVYEPGPYLPILGAFIVLAAWLLPQVCTAGAAPTPACEEPVADVSKPAESIRRSMRRPRRNLLEQIALMVLVVTAIKLAMHLLDFGLVAFMQLTDPAGWAEAFDMWVYGMVGAGSGPWPALMGTVIGWPQFVSIHVLRPMLYFGLLLPLLLFVFLWADVVLKRRALKWYGLGAQIRRVFWIITGGLAAVLALIVIPVCNHLVFPEIYRDWSGSAVAGFALGVMLAVGLGVWYWQQDRRWAGRCPACDGSTTVSGWYFPGKCCSTGNHKLHEWLVARY
jgi:hypothetical protein